MSLHKLLQYYISWKHKGVVLLVREMKVLTFSPLGVKMVQFMIMMHFLYLSNFIFFGVYILYIDAYVITLLLLTLLFISFGLLLTYILTVIRLLPLILGLPLSLLVFNQSHLNLIELIIAFGGPMLCFLLEFMI